MNGINGNVSAIARVAPAPLSDGMGEAQNLVSMWLSGRSERTITAYRRDLEDFRSFMSVETAEDASRDLLSRGQGPANATALRYRTSLQERELSSATINRRLAALRSLVKLARTVGMVSWSLDVENLKSKSYRDTRGPGKANARLLLERLEDTNGPKGARDYAIFRLLHDLALRRGEVVSLDVEDVDLERGTISILGKGRTERELLTLPNPTKTALSRWLEIGGRTSGALFVNFDRAGKGNRLTGTSLYRLIRELGKKAGFDVRPHGLRHTAITEAVKVAQANGINLEEVLDFSRHANVKTLMVYRDRERNVQGKLAALVAEAL